MITGKIIGGVLRLYCDGYIIFQKRIVNYNKKKER